MTTTGTYETPEMTAAQIREFLNLKRPHTTSDRRVRPGLFEVTLEAVRRRGWRHFTGSGTVRGEDWQAIIVDWLPSWTLHGEVDSNSLWKMERWRSQVFTPLREDAYARCNQVERMEEVEKVVEALHPKDHPANISDAFLLKPPYTDDARGLPKGDPIQAALLAAWWDSRMSEGHNPASARLLLELTLPPAVAGRLAFPEPGLVPTGEPTLLPYIP